MTEENKPQDELRVNARMFGVVAGFRAQADIRYYLQGVCCMPHPERPGALIIATDGHQLAMAYDPKGVVSRQMILRADKGAVSAALAARSTVATLDRGRLVVNKVPPDHPTKDDPHEARSVEAYIMPGCPLVNEAGLAKFPDVQRVLPENPALLNECSISEIQASYMGRIADAAKKAFPRLKFISLIHSSMGKDKTTYTRFGVLSNFSQNYLFVTMPMRGDGPMPPIPEFAIWRGEQ